MLLESSQVSKLATCDSPDGQEEEDAVVLEDLQRRLSTTLTLLVTGLHFSMHLVLCAGFFRFACFPLFVVGRFTTFFSWAEFDALQRLSPANTCAFLAQKSQFGKHPNEQRHWIAGQGKSCLRKAQKGLKWTGRIWKCWRSRPR